MKDWPYVLGALAALGALGFIVARGEPLGIGRTTPAAVPPSSEPRGRVLGAEPVTVFPSRTYFAAIETNGSVDGAATVARVKAKAEAEGFRDVVVEETKPSHWPALPDGADYFVRGTFTGAAPKAFPRHVGVFLGSANILDAWEV